MIETVSQPAIKKIVVLNPYLQRGLTESAEMESTTRFVIAANHLGIEAVVLGNSNDIHLYHPDFVVTISYQEPKLTHYPTYGLLGAPVGWVQKSPRFMRNVFSYDGYLSASPILDQWIHQVCEIANKRCYSTLATFSVPKTPFKRIDYKNATAAYLGVNWDGMRHQKLFQSFEAGNYLKCYGPPKSWEKYAPTLYGGRVPFDGISSLKVYAECGIGLCINHPDFDNEDTPSNRTFEIPASGAIAICANNPFTRTFYGDSVLYVDQKLPTRELVDAIKDRIKWVRNHPEEAQAMAKRAHDIFNEKLSMETFIKNVIEMHHRVIKNEEYLRPEPTAAKKIAYDKVTYIIPIHNIDTIYPLIYDIRNQTYPNIDIVLLTDKDPKAIEACLQLDDFKHIYIFNYTGTQNNHELITHLTKHHAKWLGVLKNDDRLAANHTAVLLKQYAISKHNKADESTVILFSNSLEHSDRNDLADKFQDGCMIYLNNTVRVGNLTPCTEIPLCSVLFKLTDETIKAFHHIDFVSNLNVEFAPSLVPLDVALHANFITTSAFVGVTKKDGLAINGEVKASVLTIKNAVAPLPILMSKSRVGQVGRLL